MEGRAQRAANDLWGFPSLKESQLEAILAAVSGKDTFVGLATGHGKSLCYQILPNILLQPSIVVVISPLIALVKDQIHRYERSSGYKGVHLKTPEDILRYMNTPQDNVRLVFMAPEQAVSHEGRQLVQNPPLPIALIAVDEAHCIHEWGDAFRKDFKELGSLRALLSLKVPFMALTATATPAVLETVKSTLHMDKPVVVKGSLDRPNIHLQVKSIKSTKGDLQPLIQHLVAAERVEDVKKHLVYAGTKNRCMELWKVIRKPCSHSKRKVVRAFHAEISTKARDEILEGFRIGTIRVVVATVAFGMGIDIPDVHGVVVYHVPTTIGQLYQVSCTSMYVYV
ncbi:ATP-dependent helicase wrn-1-like [Branchiostoma lanceolatum]|uniref:ATP-dependent helicase wrn-1-like n=1 Tax=Branchiostoma lanceolatum TaxID=7740 RepID=UPI00345673F1